MSKKYITVKRIGSPIGRPANQLATLKGLGLTRANMIRTLEDTPAIRGMVRRVNHLVEILPNSELHHVPN